MVRDVHILVEAFQYAERFRGKSIVVKMGGAEVANEMVGREIIQDILWIQEWGISPVLVHGGGPQIDAVLRERGIKPQRKDGVRVTDAKTLDVVREVLLQVNGQLVRWIEKGGGKAVGWCGTEILSGRPMPGTYELTGELEEIDAEKIRDLPRETIPVVSCLARGKDGTVYNVNADFVAISLSAALGAEKLILLTDVAGVLLDATDPSTLISTLTASQARDLMRRKVASGGMVVKLNACLEALERGVHKAHIIDAKRSHSLLAEIFTDEGAGTQIIHDVGSQEDSGVAARRPRRSSRDH